MRSQKEAHEETRAIINSGRTFEFSKLEHMIGAAILDGKFAVVVDSLSRAAQAKLVHEGYYLYIKNDKYHICWA